MKPLPLILAFTPLIVFSLLTKILPSHDVGISALVAAVIAGIALVAIKPIWPPKILNACSFVLFLILAIVGFSSGHGTDKWVASWAASGGGAWTGHGVGEWSGHRRPFGWVDSGSVDEGGAHVRRGGEGRGEIAMIRAERENPCAFELGREVGRVRLVAVAASRRVLVGLVGILAGVTGAHVTPARG